jgi:hypothetical protein
MAVPHPLPSQLSRLHDPTPRPRLLPLRLRRSSVSTSGHAVRALSSWRMAAVMGVQDMAGNVGHHSDKKRENLALGRTSRLTDYSPG